MLSLKLASMGEGILLGTLCSAVKKAFPIFQRQMKIMLSNLNIFSFSGMLLLGYNIFIPYQRALSLGTLYTHLCIVLKRRNAPLTGSTLLTHSCRYLCTSSPHHTLTRIGRQRSQLSQTEYLSTTLSKFSSEMSSNSCSPTGQPIS